MKTSDPRAAAQSCRSPRTVSGLRSRSICALSLFTVPWVLSACSARQPPYSPLEAIRTFQLAPGFRIELVAAEPEIMDPVAIAFDARGRMFVAEMSDYPMGAGSGRIKLLEDRDGDGRYERSTLFAQGLSFPNGVMPWRNGILVTAAPDILYLEDADGDGRADARRVVVTGFAKANPQLRLNGLHFGIDNWIYAAYPKTLVPNRYPREFGDEGHPLRFPDHPEIPPVDLQRKAMDVRFQIEVPRLETVAGNSQFGQAFDKWGNRFTLWNNDHIRHVVLQNLYLSRNPFLAADSAMTSISDHGKAADVFSITKNPLQMHESEIGHFTSACGISVYEGGLFPEKYSGAVFVCEPVHNLVHCDLISPAGATFSARRADTGKEFLSSTDSWFSPVFTTTGPDGALYIVDFYRRIIEHPEWIPAEMQGRPPDLSGNRMGRIYRVLPDSVSSGQRHQAPKAGDSAWVDYLSHPNLWWRLTAQRLLVERRDRAVVPALKRLARDGSTPEGRLHALFALAGLGSIDGDLVSAALRDDHPAVRERAVELAESLLEDPKIYAQLLELAADPGVRVQFQLACTLAQLRDPRTFEALQGVLFRNLEDTWFQTAVLAAPPGSAVRWFRVAARRRSDNEEALAAFLERVASVIGAEGEADSVEEVLAAGAGTLHSQPQKHAALKGLADGLERGGSDLRRRLPSRAQRTLIGLLGAASPSLRRPALRIAARVDLADTTDLQTLIRTRAELSRDVHAGVEARADALRVLGLDPSSSSLGYLEGLLTPKEPEMIQLAAAEAVLMLRNPTGIRTLLDRWRTFTAPVREKVLAAFFSERRFLPLLLEAIEAGKIQTWSLTRARRTQLLRSSDSEVRLRAEKLLSDRQKGDRGQVLDEYRASLRMTGNADRGREVFRAQCSKCHRAGGEGFEVGPDLASLTNRTREELLTQILDPNDTMSPGYEEYVVETSDGRLITGVIGGQTATAVVLRRGGGEEDTILRSAIRDLRSLNISQMPENLEAGIDLQAMADLLQFLKSSGAR